MTDEPPSGLPEGTLNLLRVVAVTCVVADHALGLWGPTVGRVPLITVGHLGVAIFFVHSAAVLMASLERMQSHAPGAMALWAKFMVRRALRIYPLAIVAILGVVALAIPPSAGRLSAPSVFVPPSAASLAANLALVQNVVPGMLDLISVLWTLPIEMQLYLLLPFAFLVARRGWRPTAVMLAVTIPLAVAVRMGSSGWAAPVTALRFAPCFAAGVLAWALCWHAPDRARWSWLQAGAAMTVLVSAYVSLDPWNPSVVRSWAFCLSLGLLVARLPELPGGAVARLAESVAKHSYGVYLFHVPLLWLAFQHRRSLGVLLDGLLFAGLLVAVCIVSYRFVEKPLIELGRRLSA